MERCKAGTKYKRSPDGLSIARAYRPPRELLPKTVDDQVNNLTNLHLYSINYHLVVNATMTYLWHYVTGFAYLLLVLHPINCVF